MAWPCGLLRFILTKFAYLWVFYHDNCLRLNTVTLIHYIAQIIINYYLFIVIIDFVFIVALAGWSSYCRRWAFSFTHDSLPEQQTPPLPHSKCLHVRELLRICIKVLLLHPMGTGKAVLVLHIPPHTPSKLCPTAHSSWACIGGGVSIVYADKRCQVPGSVSESPVEAVEELNAPGGALQSCTWWSPNSTITLQTKIHPPVSRGPDCPGWGSCPPWEAVHFLDEASTGQQPWSNHGDSSTLLVPVSYKVFP